MTSAGSWNLGSTVNIGGATGTAGTLQFFNSGVSVARSANSGLTITTSGSGYGGGTTITNTSASGVKLTVTGAASQTANLQEWQDSSNTTLASLSASGDLNLLGGKALYSYGTGDPTTADARWGNFYNNGTATRFLTSGKGTYASNIPDMYFDKYNGTTLTTMMMLQSSTGNLGIGTTTIGTNNRLIVNPYSTVDNLATAQINTNAATNKGLVVQGLLSQTANLQEWQSSTGTSLSSVNASGAFFIGSASTSSGSAMLQVRNNTYGDIASFLGNNGTVKIIGGSKIELGSAVAYVDYNELALTNNSGNIVIRNSYNGPNSGVTIRANGTGVGTNADVVFQTQSGSVETMRIKGSGNVGIGEASPSAKLQVTNTTAATVATIIKGASGQTANLQEWQSSAGTALASVSATGAGSFVSLTQNGNNVCDISNNCSYAASSGSTSYIQNGTTIQTNANLAIQSASASSVGAVIRGAASQTANLQEWQDSAGTVLTSISSGGGLQFGAGQLVVARTAGTTLRISNAVDAGGTGGVVQVGGYYGTGSYRSGIIISAGTSTNYNGSIEFLYQGSNSSFLTAMPSTTRALKLDTRFAINTSYGDVNANTKLTVNSPAAEDATVLFGSSSSGSKGLVVQGAASQTANLQEWQSSFGTALAYVNASGDISTSRYMAVNGATLGATLSGQTAVLNVNGYAGIDGVRIGGNSILGTAGGRIDLGTNTISSGNWTIGVNTLSLGTAGLSRLTVDTLSDYRGIIVRGNASQTLNLQEWQNSSSTVLTAIAADGDIVSTEQISIGNITPLTGVRLSVYANTPAVKGLVVRAAGSQTANLQEWQSSSGTALALISSDGKFNAGNASGPVSNTSYDAYNLMINGTTYGAVKAYYNGSGSGGFGGVSLWAYQGGSMIENVRIGQFSFGTQIFAPTAGTVALAVKGAASQTANLQEWQNSSGSVLTSVNSSGWLGIGTSSPTSQLSVVDEGGSTASRGISVYQNSTNASAGIFTYWKSRGTNSVPLAVTNGDNIGAFWARGHDGTAYLGSGAFGFFVDGAVSTGSVPTGYYISTGTDGMANAQQNARFYIDSVGNVGIGNALNAPGGRLQVDTGSASNKGLIVKGAAAQTANLQEWQNSSGTTLSYLDNNGSLSINNSAALTGATKLRVKGGTSLSTSGTDGWTLNGVTNGTQFFTSETGSYGSPSVMGMSGEWSSSTVPTLSTYGYMGGYFGARGSGTRILIGSRSEAISLATISGDTVYGSQGIASFENPATATGGTAIGLQGTATTNTSSSGDRHVYGVSGSATSNGANTFAYGGNFTANGTGTNIALRAVSGTATTKGLVVRGASSQSANLQEWQDNTGAVLASINGAGNIFTIGSGYTITAGSGNWVFNNNSIHTPSIRQNTGTLATTGATTILQWSNTVSNGAIEVTSTAATQKGLIVKGAAAQTANLQEWQNSSGTLLGSVKSDGSLVVGSGNQYLSSASLTVRGTGSVQTAFIQNAASSSTSGSGIIGIQDDGAATSSGDRLGYILLGGAYDASNNAYHSAGITAFASQDFATGSGGSELRFEVMANNSSTRTLRVAIPQGLDGFTFGASQDTNLYRNGTGILKTNGTLQVGGNIAFDPSSYSSFNGTSVSGVVQVTSATATAKGLVVKGAASQSANLQEWQNSSGTALGQVSSDGSMTIGYTGKTFRTLSVIQNTLAGNNDAYSVASFTATGAGDTSQNIAFNATTSSFNFSGAGGLQIQHAYSTTSVNIRSDGTKFGANAASWNVAPLGQVEVVTASAARKALVVQGAASQTANLQEWQNSSGTVLLSVGSTGVINSSATGTEHDLGVNLGVRVGTFLRFGGGSGGASTGVIRMFNSNLINWRNAANTGNIGITVNGSDTLQLGAAATTPDALSDTTIGTSATTRKGLVIQGLASQTANLQEWQSSTGTVLASISSAGNLTVVNATVNGTLVVNGASTFNGNITVNGKIITGNASGSTTVTVDTAGAGTGATASISGNDTSGVITINTGTGAAAGKLATITFSAAFPSSPNVVITPKTIPGGGAYPQYHYDSATGTFDLSSFNALTDSSTYTFSYFITD